MLDLAAKRDLQKGTAFGASSAFAFVLAIGVVNLFGDMTYEGGAAMNGQFMAALGASAAAVSITAGLGEFVGYALRSVSGSIADRTRRYWLVTFVGYGINLLAVPAMALAGNWRLASALILVERTGRALRKPAVEAMLSYTTGKHGRGWVYGVNTALDETGATLGPLVIALVLLHGGSYRAGYALLLISSALALAALIVARINFPLPERFEESRATAARGFDSAYWLYMIAGACFAAGLMSYELVAFHLATTKAVGQQWIPVLLALSTGSGVAANLVLGRLYDRAHLPTILVAVLVSSLFAPLAFLGSFPFLLAAMVVWGVGYATQDTLFKAVIAGVLPEGQRGLAFGLFYLGYGLGWLFGSVATGVLYEHSRTALISFAMAAQLVSLPLFIAARRQEARR